MAKVYALKEHVKRDMFYPIGRIKFNDDGESDWPLDQFTQRRIRDGDISFDPPTKRLESAKTESAPSKPTSKP
jgi:hypothetical protein